MLTRVAPLWLSFITPCNNTVEEAFRTLTSPERKVSSHYLIGLVVQLVQENKRAWHAGESWWSGITYINSISLGIELDNNGYQLHSAC